MVLFVMGMENMFKSLVEWIDDLKCNNAQQEHCLLQAATGSWRDNTVMSQMFEVMWMLKQRPLTVSFW